MSKQRNILNIIDAHQKEYEHQLDDIAKHKKLVTSFKHDKHLFDLLDELKQKTLTIKPCNE